MPCMDPMGNATGLFAINSSLEMYVICFVFVESYLEVLMGKNIVLTRYCNILPELDFVPNKLL